MRFVILKKRSFYKFFVHLFSLENIILPSMDFADKIFIQVEVYREKKTLLMPILLYYIFLIVREI